MLALLKELGIEHFDYMSGKTRLEYKGKRCDYRGDMYFHMLPPEKAGETPAALATEAEIDDARAAWKKMEAVIEGFQKGHRAFDHPDAEELDGQTMQTWLQQNTKTDFAKFLFTVAVATVGPLGPAHVSQISPLHFAWSQFMSPQRESPEAYLIRGGAGQIPPKLAGKIGLDRVRLGQDVVELVRDQDVVRARTRHGSVFCGRCAVVACPPSVASAIVYDPPLTAQRHQLMQRFAMGTIAKVLVAYPEPFWKEKGKGGDGGNGEIVMCVSLDSKYVEFTADSSDPSKKTGVVAAFIQGRKYFEWKKLPSQEERQEAVLRDLEQLYCRPEMRKPVAVEYGDWPKDQFAGGGYAGTVPPGTWTQYGPGLHGTEWDGRVDFAGTEYSKRWAGFFEGAASSADDVVERLSKLL